MSTSHKPLLCLDFDGVLHSYTSGWQGDEVVSDPPVPGAMQALTTYTETFRVAIYSSRSRREGGVVAMRHWLDTHLVRALGGAEAGRVFRAIEWPTGKPAAFLTLDDRAMTFTGTWPSLDEVASFQLWNKREAKQTENLLKVDARGIHVTLAGLLDAKRSEVADLERRIRACPHDWSVRSTSVETLYAKGFGPNGERLPPIHVRVTTSVCRRCGSAKVDREDIDG